MAQQSEHVVYERFTFHSRALSHDYDCKVVRFKGTEGIGTLYSFEIDIMCQKQLNTSALLSAPCFLRIDRNDAQAAFFHGYLTAIRQEHHVNGWTFYTLRLEPQFAKLKHLVQNCIYIEKNAQQILEHAFGNAGILKPRHSFMLHNDYPTYEFSMQYNENMYDYMLFIIEHEGFYYYFEQHEDNEHIIFTDSPLKHTHMDGTQHLRYYPTSGLEGGHTEEIIASMTRHQEPLPKEIYVRDYDWKNPQITVEATATVDEHGVGTLFFYNDGFTTSAQGQRLADARADALRCRGTLFHGISSVPTLRPGYTFTLTDHYDESWNTAYLTTHITHEGSQEGYLSSVLGIHIEYLSDAFYYRNNFTCIPKDTPFRLERKTQRRKIPGVIHAFIDSSSTANTPEIDAYGRYKVVFPQDTSGRGSGKASCWIRRAQPSVGAGYGTSFPLDPGVEVIIAFMDGNPDRPFIAGALSNPQTGSTDNAANTMFSGMTSACGGGLTFNDSPQKQGFNLTTGSGRSGMFMSSGSLDQSMVRTDTYTQFSTVAANNFATLFQNSSSGTFNELSVFKSLKPATIMTTASKVLANVSEELRKNNAAAAAANSLTDAIHAQQEAKKNLEKAQANEALAQQNLENCKSNCLKSIPHNKVESDKTLQLAQLNAEKATWQREDAEKSLLHASQGITEAQEAQGKSKAAESWDTATTTLKALGALGAFAAHAHDTWGGLIDKMPSPYGAVLGASDEKNSLRLVIEGDKLRSTLVTSFLVLYIASQANKSLATSKESERENEEFKKHLNRETTEKKVAFLSRDKEAVLKENTYLALYKTQKKNLDKACEDALTKKRAEHEEGKKKLEATKKGLPLNSPDRKKKIAELDEEFALTCQRELEEIRLSFARKEAEIMQQAEKTVNSMSEQEKIASYDKIYKNVLASLDEAKAQQLADRKSAQTRALTVTLSELVAELMLNYLNYKKAVTDWDVPHGGVKLASKKNIASTSTHTYFSAANGISLLTLPQACDFVDTTPAEKHVDIHKDFFDLQADKSFIVAETEQVRIVGLEDTHMFGTENLTLRSAKTVSISNEFHDDETHRRPLTATLRRMPEESRAFFEQSLTTLNAAKLKKINPLNAIARQGFLTKIDDAKARYETGQTLIRALGERPLSEAYSKIILDNDKQSLSLLNTGKLLSIQQKNPENQDDSTLSVIYLSKDHRNSELGFYKDHSTLWHQSDTEHTASLAFTKDAATLTYKNTTTLELKDKSVSLNVENNASKLEFNDSKTTLTNSTLTLKSDSSTIESTKSGISLDANAITLKGAWGNFEGKSGKITMNAKGIIAIG